jgi:hypothetical protein
LSVGILLAFYTNKADAIQLDESGDEFMRPAITPIMII